MALTILSTPNLMEPSYTLDGANLAIVADSDDSALCSFKYVGDVIINNDPKVVIKVSPNLQNGKGIISPNRIIEDFLSYDLHRSSSIFQEASNSFLEWDCVIGEESDGTLDCSGDNYIIAYGITVSGYAWNGTKQYDDDYTYTDFLMGATGPSRFLTNAPNETTIRVQENSYLYFLNDIDATAHIGPTAVPNGYPIALEVTVTPITGSNVIYYIVPDINIESNKMYSVGTGPGDINSYVFRDQVFRTNGNAVTDFIIDCNTKSYSVRLTNVLIVA